jgi:hypothetical protein
MIQRPIRGCDTAVFGTLGSDWRRHAVVVGPLAWLGTEGYASEPARHFRDRGGGRYLFQKALIVLEPRALVTVVVPVGERGRLALAYGGSSPADNLFELSEGEPRWSFRACADAETQFNGGFVVAGAQCAVLDISVQGRAEPMQASIGFGRQCSS